MQFNWTFIVYFTDYKTVFEESKEKMCLEFQTLTAHQLQTENVAYSVS